MATWRSGYAADCKSVYTGSSPVVASKKNSPKKEQVIYNFATNLKGSSEWFQGIERQINNYELAPLHRTLRQKSFDVQYNAPRPLYNWKSEELIRLADNGLKRTWPSIELPSLALFELAKRHRTSDSESVNELFKSKNIIPINWLDSLNSVIRKELNITKTKTYKAKKRSNSIYVILIDFKKAKKGYGLYIGSSHAENNGDNSFNQETMVAEHFQGLKNSFECKNFGMEPLWSISSMFDTSEYTRKQLLIMKSKIHTIAKTIVPNVLGERPYLDLLRNDKKFSKFLQRER